MRSQLVIASVAFLAAGAPVNAQPCQPYWAGIDARPIPGWPIAFQPVSVPIQQTPTLFARAGHPDFPPGASWPHRWSSQSWRELAVSGVPPGSSGSLYSIRVEEEHNLLWRIVSPLSAWAMHRFDGDSWVIMQGFWPEQQGYEIWNADLWGSERIVGYMYWATVGVYTGTGWLPIGTHNSSEGAIHIAISHGTPSRLYIFGAFTQINGIPALGFARYDGQNWTSPWPEPVEKGNGVPDAVVFDDGSGPAIFTNSVPHFNGTYRQGLHKWDGTTWTFIGGPVPGSFIETWDLQVFDDGRGPALYIGGAFNNFGGVAANCLVRYSAAGFEPVGGGVPSGVKKMGVMQDERGLSLWVQGQSAAVSVAGGTVYGLAQWVGCKLGNCYANCDASTTPPVLTANDFLCFINKFATKDPYANCDLSTLTPAINAADFQCFITKFAAGCP